MTLNGLVCAECRYEATHSLTQEGYGQWRIYELKQAAMHLLCPPLSSHTSPSLLSLLFSSPPFPSFTVPYNFPIPPLPSPSHPPCSLLPFLPFTLPSPLLQLGDLGRAASSPSRVRAEPVFHRFDSQNYVWWQKISSVSAAGADDLLVQSTQLNRKHVLY